MKGLAAKVRFHNRSVIYFISTFVAIEWTL